MTQDHSGRALREAALSASPTEPVPVSSLTGDDQPRVPVILEREVFDFLMGTAAYDGTWFDDLNDNLPGRFWWRAVLRAAERGTPRLIEGLAND